MGVIIRLAIAALLSLPLVSGSFAADAKSHRVSIQVDQNDPQVMNLALGNAPLSFGSAKNRDAPADARQPHIHACAYCQRVPKLGDTA